jgi:hypothetical protein
MPAGTALSRVNKSEFFAILGPGLYVVGSVALLVAAWQKQESAKEGLRWAAALVERHWSIAAGLLFLAFLVGNVLRAPRGNIADANCQRFFSVFRQARSAETRLGELLRSRFVPAFLRPKDTLPFDEAVSGGKFPYAQMLDLVVQDLNESEKHLELTIPERDGAQHVLFNYWKAILCHKSERGYESALEQEARVRLFVNMYRGALLGMLPAGLGAILCAFQYFRGHWWWLMGIAFLASAVIAGVFGSQIRRVRGHEVLVVFLTYLALRDAGGTDPKEQEGSKSVKAEQKSGAT